jgi:hypothetical protein
MKSTNLLSALICFTVLGLGGCSTPPNASGSYITRATDLGPAQEQNEASVIVVRATDTDPVAVYNLHVNGQYHAALLRGSWSQFNLCAGTARMLITPDAAILKAPGTPATAQLNLVAGQTQYYSANNGTLTPISAEQGAALKASLNLSQHTLSRLVPSACKK